MNCTDISYFVQFMALCFFKGGKNSLQNSPPFAFVMSINLEHDLQAQLHISAAAAELAGIQELKSGNISVGAAERIIGGLLVGRQSETELTMVERIEEFRAKLDLS